MFKFQCIQSGYGKLNFRDHGEKPQQLQLAEGDVLNIEDKQLLKDPATS